MYTFCYYYLFSITKGRFEFVTESQKEFEKCIAMDESLKKLSTDDKHNYYKDFITDEEFVTDMFVSTYLSSNDALLTYIINDDGSPQIVKDLNFYHDVKSQTINIYYSQNQLKAIV